MKPLDFPPEWAVSRETLDRLRLYYELLLKWQAKINLISPATIPQAWERHFIDSAQLSPILPTGLSSLYDLGSGAGFAGLVLGIMHPELPVTLIESDAKKCAFLQTVSRETGIVVKILNKRIEAVSRETAPPSCVTARALASLDMLLVYCEPWILGNSDLSLVFPKGENFAEEVAQARQKWRFNLDETPSVTDPKARILTLSSVQKIAE